MLKELELQGANMLLTRIQQKHKALKKRDGGSFFKRPAYKVFGSERHKYQFNACLSADEICRFENTHTITLPDDYKWFLTTMGNGGSGPAYGLFPLQKWNLELDIDDTRFLATPFPYTDKWNLPKTFDDSQDDYTETDAFQRWEQDYYANRHITGSMRICHYGCAIYYLLVVTGNEAGHIWVDDRASDYGIYPALSKTTGEKLSFSAWYEEWLTENV